MIFDKETLHQRASDLLDTCGLITQTMIRPASVPLQWLKPTFHRTTEALVQSDLIVAILSYMDSWPAMHTPRADEVLPLFLNAMPTIPCTGGNGMVRRSIHNACSASMAQKKAIACLHQRSGQGHRPCKCWWNPSSSILHALLFVKAQHLRGSWLRMNDTWHDKLHAPPPPPPPTPPPSLLHHTVNYQPCSRYSWHVRDHRHRELCMLCLA